MSVTASPSSVLAPAPSPVQSPGPDGPVEVRDPLSGLIQETYHRQAGHIHGRYTRFAHGKVIQIAQFENGILHGEQTFFRHGQIESRLPMVKGLLHGEALFFRRGLLAMSLTYAQGFKHGPCTVFSKGHPSAHLLYEKNALSGTLVSLDPQTGQPLAHIPMHNGVPQGAARYWTPDGYLTRHETFDAGKRSGQAIDYTPDGRMIGQHFFRDDRLDGPSVRYHPKGTVAEVRTYQQGALVGVETYSEKGGLVSRHGVASGWDSPVSAATPDTQSWWKSLVKRQGDPPPTHGG